MKFTDVNFQIYQDVNKLISIIHDQTTQFPTAYRFTLGNDLKRDGLKLVNSIHRINTSPSESENFYQFLDDVEAMRAEISICYDLQLIDINVYSDIILLIRSIRQQSASRSKFGTAASDTDEHFWIRSSPSSN